MLILRVYPHILYFTYDILLQKFVLLFEFLRGGILMILMILSL